MEKEISGVTLSCIKGDITVQDVEAVVNAANADLSPGGGVSGAIHTAAGSGLYNECMQLAPIEPGEAVITKGYGLPNDYVVHCLGPRYGVDEPSDELLSQCYSEALRLADSKGVISIAFPAISTGSFGYPMEDAALISLKSVKNTMTELTSISEVRFVLYDDQSLEIYERAMSRIFEGED